MSALQSTIAMKALFKECVTIIIENLQAVIGEPLLCTMVVNESAYAV